MTTYINAELLLNYIKSGKIRTSVDLERYFQNKSVEDEVRSLLRTLVFHESILARVVPNGEKLMVEYSFLKY